MLRILAVGLAVAATTQATPIAHSHPRPHAHRQGARPVVVVPYDIVASPTPRAAKKPAPKRKPYPGYDVFSTTKN